MNGRIRSTVSIYAVSVLVVLGDFRKEVIDRQIALMHERDIWPRPI